MAKKNLLALLILFFGLEILTAGGKSDSFFFDSIDTKYPSSSYVIGIGSGATRQNAESSAKLSLCQNLGESISGTQEVFVSSDTQGSDQGSLSLLVNESVLFEHITGITIKDCVQDKKGNFTALAVLDRNEASSFYTSRARESDVQICNLVKKAQDAQGSFESITLMEQAITLAEDNQYNLELLRAVNTSGTRTLMMNYGSVSELKIKKNNLAKELSVFVEIKGDDDLRITQTICTQISKKGARVVSQKSDAIFCVEGTVSFEEASMPNNNGFFLRYNLVSPLTKIEDGSVILPYSCSGREGHTLQSQVKARTITKICTRVSEEFLP